MRFLALTVSLFSTIPAFADTPANFDATKWNTLVQNVSAKGTRADLVDGVTFKTFSVINPRDTARPHTAEYFSTVGSVDSEGQFAATSVSAVSENWSIDQEGNWVIDQWLWNTTLNGDLLSLNHSVLRETATGRVLSIDTFPTGGVHDTAELARWGAKLDFWFHAPASGLRR